MPLMPAALSALRFLAPLLAALIAVSSVRAADDAAREPAQLEGRTLDGQPFNLAGQRGKVVLVVLWSTGCAVCRDVLPELRANYAGWRGKPFELVTVATDTRREDVLDYERLLERIRPGEAHFPSLWRLEPGHSDGFGPAARLPVAFVIDAQGRIAERFAGRIPPQAWDRIAELLP